MPGRRAEHSASSLEVRYNSNPNSRLFSRAADEYRKEGNIAKAIDICMKGLDDYPDYVTGRIILGRCYLEQENLDGAIQEFTRACEIDRKNHVAIKMLADIFARQGFEEKAGDLYSILLKMDPANLSIKQLRSQSKSTGNIDLYNILGISSPQLQAEQHFTSNNLESENQDLQPAIDFNENEISEIIPQESHDLQFTEELDTVDTNQVQEISGEDISDRMAIMFGDKETTAPNNTEQTSGNEIELAIPQISEPENSGIEPPQQMESSSITELNEDVSGLDISTRIDELFGEEAGKKADVEIVDEPSSDSHEQPLLSDFGNDFGETVKLDRSILDSIHEDIQNKTSDSSGESLIEDLKADIGKIELISESDSFEPEVENFSESVVPENNSIEELDLVTEDDSPVVDDSESAPEIENAAHEELVSETDLLAEDSSIKLPNTSEIDLITIDDSPVDSVVDLPKENSGQEEFVSEMDVLIDDFQSEENSDEIELISDDTASINKDSPSEVITSETSEAQVEEHVSEMDILAEETPGSVQLSGDDIAEKIDLLFGEQSNVSEVTDHSLPPDIIENGPLTSESDLMLDEIEPLEIISSKENSNESSTDNLETPTLEINVEELESEQISLSDADLNETIMMQDEDEHEALPEESLSINEQTDTSFLDENIEEIIDSGTPISPSDIEKRLKDLFPDNISLPIGIVPDDEVEQQDNTVGDFYTVSGENASDDVAFEDLEDFGKVEIESPVEIISTEDISSEDINTTEPEFSSEPIEPVNSLEELEETDKQDLVSAKPHSSEIDDRDKPYSIPDHVITPTLADLYFQQGQPQLAIQIYERLLKQDPDNDKFKNRISQIRQAIDTGVSDQFTNTQEAKPVSDNSKIKKTATRTSGRKKPVDNRPLAGVRIKKNKKK